MKFDLLCFDMLITELNNIAQMQHQLRSKSQLTEYLRNISYLSKLLLAGNHINFSKTHSEIAEPSCQMFYTLMVNQAKPQGPSSSFVLSVPLIVFS